MSKISEIKTSIYLMLVEKERLTKWDICVWFNLTERQARKAIANLAHEYPIIALSDTKGYQLAKTENDLEKIEHAWKEIDKRQKELEKRKVPLMEFRDKIQKTLFKKGEIL